MKLKISICIFLIICLSAIILLQKNTITKDEEPKMIYHTDFSNSNLEPSEKIEEPDIMANKEVQYYNYMIYQDGDRLTVYNADNTTVFMETNILVNDLPQEVKEKLTTGIGFKSEEELYDFLESYSS